MTSRLSKPAPASKKSHHGRKLVLVFTALTCLADTLDNAHRPTGAPLGPPGVSPTGARGAACDSTQMGFNEELEARRGPAARAGDLAGRDNRHSGLPIHQLINDTFKCARLYNQVVNGPRDNCRGRHEQHHNCNKNKRPRSGQRPPPNNESTWPAIGRRLWASLPRISAAHAIRIVRLEAPQSARAGQTIRFKCVYDAKNDKLQSLSWYKNGREFYRFQPFERRQPVLAFNTTGIQLDLSRSRNNTITLVNTTVETSGRYKCEATGISFQEATMDTNVDVLPAISSGSTTSLSRSQSLNSLLIIFATILITAST